MTQPATAPQRPSLRRWVLRLSAAYGVCVALVAVGQWAWADDAPLPTLFLFGPRWVVAAPLLLLIPATAFARSRMAAVLVAAAGVVVAGPVTGGTVHLGGLAGGTPGDAPLRIMTWNTAGQDLSHEAVRNYIQAVRPDIVLFQEAGAQVRAENFPTGWGVAAGPVGVGVATRFPVRAADGLGPADLGAQGGVGRFVIDLPGSQLVVMNVHLPTPRAGIEAVLHKKFDGFPEMRAAMAARDQASKTARRWVGDPDPGVFVAGDFNALAEGTLFRRDWGAFGDAFGDAGFGWGTTKQTRWFGARIDHILYAPPWKCSRVRVGPDLGSDHRPLVADFVLQPDS